MSLKTVTTAIMENSTRIVGAIVALASIGASVVIWTSSKPDNKIAQDDPENMERVIAEALEIANAGSDKEKWNYARLAEAARPMSLPPRNPEQYIGDYVRATPITGCFKYEDQYMCSGYSYSIMGRILVVGNQLVGEVKDRIDRECHSLKRMCRADIVFRFDSWKLDLSGESMLIRTETIHATTVR